MEIRCMFCNLINECNLNIDDKMSVILNILSKTNYYNNGSFVLLNQKEILYNCNIYNPDLFLEKIKLKYLLVDNELDLTYIKINIA
jgi:hypothetical protein